MSINPIQPTISFPEPSIKKASSQISPPPIILFHEVVQENGAENIKRPWDQRAITFLNEIDHLLEKKIPNHLIQNKIDRIGNVLQVKFSRFQVFNEWLDSNGQGEWYKQLATFLAKLPARAVRNVIRLVYQIIKAAIYAVVHPLKSLNLLAKLMISLVQSLAHPVTWSKIGAGMLGASLGQALISGNPLSLIGMGIGAACLIGGISSGAILSAIKAEKGFKLEAAKQDFFNQAKQLPEVAITGFLTGLLIGGIQRAFNLSFKLTDKKAAREYIDTFVKENNLPQPEGFHLVEDGMIKIFWDKADLQLLTKTHPHFFSPLQTNEFLKDVFMELCPGKGKLILETGHLYLSNAASRSLPIHSIPGPLPILKSSLHGKSLSSLGILKTYPHHPINMPLTSIALIGGAASKK